MKNEFYKLKDVPKEKRLGHFFDYYIPYVLGALLLVAVVGYVVFGLLQPDSDIAVLWLSDKYTYDCENALRKTLEDSSWDIDGDGEVNEMLTYIEFTDEYSKLSLQTMSEINTLVGGQQYSFFLVNDYAKEWMQKGEILGTWKDAGIDKPGYLSVPVKELPSFDTEDMKELNHLYLVISSPDTGKNKEDVYEKQIKALKAFLIEEGVL